jgi:hypothetical protein
VVHLLSGALAGAVFAALLQADGRQRTILRQAVAGAGFGLGLGAGWEALEWAMALIGDWRDTWTDVALTGLGAAAAAMVAAWHRPRREASHATPHANTNGQRGG